MANSSSPRSGRVIAATFATGLQPIVGTLVGIDEDGTVRVDFPGNTLGALPARLMHSVASAPIPVQDDPLAALLVFENGDRSEPLVLGWVAETWTGPMQVPVGRTDTRREVIVEGRSLVLRADEELVLRCGNASIQLRRDGKLIIKGTELVSRASGVNKIKGGVVNIN